MLKLTPRIYKQNMQWSLLPASKIDTVVMQPISNESPEEPVVFHTEVFRDADLDGSNVQLPVANSRLPSHYRYVNNVDNGVEFAKARIECIIATGSRTITIDEAISGNVSVDIVLEGTSSIISRGTGTYNLFPTIDQLVDEDFSLATWIQNNSISSQNYLTWNYGDDTLPRAFSMNPWVRNVVPIGDKTPSVTNAFPWDIPQYNDILTEWNDPGRNQAMALRTNWYDVSSWVSTSNPFVMLPYNTLKDPETGLLEAISMTDRKLRYHAYATKLSDHTYKIQWSAPIRLAYMAASRTRNLFGTMAECDNYAFVDNVNAISIRLIGNPYSTDKIDISYSLGSDGVLTTETLDQHPLRIDSAESYTIGSTMSDELWTTTMSRNLLDKYKHGKYVVSCTVPATWALSNGVTANSQIQIVLQDGNYITRNGVVCIFEVKNIEKCFNNNEFCYRLKLMEV